MRKVTLVYPGIAVIGFDSLGGQQHDTISVNLGLAYIGSYIKKHSKHSVNLIDLRDVKSWNEYEKQLKERSPDIVGIYCNTVNVGNSLKCAEIAKKHGFTVVMGGPHATLAPQSLLDSGSVDCVVVGEGEKSFLAILDDMDAGKTPQKIVQGKKVNDLDDLPFPDRDLYNMKRILGGAGIFPYPSRYVGIVASRGCYYNCAFCQPLEKKIFGNKVRTRSVANIVAEVKDVIQRYDANFIMFECDTLTTQKPWAMELCREMKPLGVTWGAQSRADTLDDELAAAMREAGCVVLFIGFESGSPRILDFLRKGIDPADSVKAAQICRRNRILIFANYMLGIPTETEDDLKLTYDLLRIMKPELHSPAYFSPIPGSDLFDYCDAQGLIKTSHYEDFIRNPTLEKVKGIDYKLLDVYKDRMIACKRGWWTEWHFAKLVLARWFALIRRGYIMSFIVELANSAPSFIRKRLIVFKDMLKSSKHPNADKEKYYPGT